MNGRILVAYYSMSGNTRSLAKEIRGWLQADIEEIIEPHHRRGRIGIARALLDTALRRRPRIIAAGKDPAEFDLLVLGGPIWAGRIAAPVRSYAARYGMLARRVAFFCTEGGEGSQAAFSELEKLCRKAPVATLVVTAAQLPIGAHVAELSQFITRISRSDAGHRQSSPLVAEVRA